MKDGFWGIPLNVPLDEYSKTSQSGTFSQILAEQQTDGKLYVMKLRRKEEGAQTLSKQQPVLHASMSKSDPLVYYIVKEIEETHDFQEGDFYLKFFHCAHIVKNYDQVAAPALKKRYLILELLNGGSVTNKLDKEQRQFLESAQVKQIALEMLQALSCLHSQQIYHMDIKPDNICWDSINNRYKLIDFSRSKKGSQGEYRIGTEIYESPEKRLRMPIRNFAACDLFSLGLSLVRIWFGYDKLKTLSGELGKIIRDQNWQQQRSLDLKSIYLEKTQGTTEEEELLNLITALLVLNPERRANADSLLSKYGGQICPQLHRVPMIRPRPPHLLPKGTAEHNKRFDDLLRLYYTDLMSSRNSLFSGRHSLEPEASPVTASNTNPPEDIEDMQLHAEIKKISDMTAAKTALEVPEISGKSRLKQILESRPELLGKFLDQQLDDSKQSSWQYFSICAANPQEQEFMQQSGELGEFRVPSIKVALTDLRLHPAESPADGHFFGTANLTGLGVLRLSALGAFYLGQFRAGSPEGFAIIALDTTMEPVCENNDEQVKNNIDMYLDSLFGGKDAPETKLTERSLWQSLFQFESGRTYVTSFIGSIERGRPAPLSTCWLEYSDKLRVSAVISDWTLSGQCLLYFGEHSTVDGTFSKGVWDRHAKFRLCSMQPAGLRVTPGTEAKRTVFHRNGSGQPIKLITEDGWIYISDQHWLTFRDSCGTITMESNKKVIDIKYFGAWREFKLCDPNGKLELSLYYKPDVNDKLSGFTFEKCSIFENLWISENKNVSKARSQPPEGHFKQDIKETNSRRTLKVSYTGGFKENTFDTEGCKGKLKLIADWINIEVEYTGGFEKGAFHGKGGELRLADRSQQRTVLIHSDFSAGELEGQANVSIRDFSTGKPIMKITANFKSGKLCGKLLMEWDENQTYSSFETCFPKEGEKYGTTNLFLGLKRGIVRYTSKTVYEGQVRLKRARTQHMQTASSTKSTTSNRSQSLNIYPNSSVLRNPLLSTLDGISWDALSSYFHNFCEVIVERSGTGTCNLSAEEAKNMPLQHRYTRYEGTWIDDHIEGHGKMQKAQDEWVYEGSFNSKGLYHGPGILVHNVSNRRYRGSFVDGKLPRGTLEYRQEECQHDYEGGFDEEFREHGKDSVLKTPEFTATIACNQGVPYSGRLVFPFMDGQNVYSGALNKYKFDDPSGQAYIQTKWYRFQGSFKDDMIIGRGRLNIFALPPELLSSEELQFYHGPIEANMTLGKQVEMIFFNGDEFSGTLDRFIPNRLASGTDLSMSFSLSGVEQPSEDSKLSPKDSLPARFQIDYPRREQIYGTGKFRLYKLKRVYSGFVVQGYPHGEGTCSGLMLGQEYTYRGQLLRGLFHGRGKVAFANHDYIFSEQWDRDVLRHGVIFHAASEQRYSGDVLNYTRHGKGVVEYPSKDKCGYKRFEGTFSHGKIEGFGRMEFQDGGYFEGTFLNGSQNGPGLRAYKTHIIKGDGFRSFRLVGPALYYVFAPGKAPRGDLFEGKFHDGVLESQRVYKDCKDFPYTSPYNPESLECSALFEGKINPNGEMIDPSARVNYYKRRMSYEGSIVKYLRDGQGELKFYSDHAYMRGAVIKGTFKKDEVKGTCSVHYSDLFKQKLYIGEVDDRFQPKGKGIIYFGDQKKWEGSFEKGRPKGKGELMQNKTKSDVDAKLILNEMTFFDVGGLI